MKKEYSDCEESCIFFQALPFDYKRFNRRARVVTKEGGEFPGSAGSMCGACTAQKNIDTALTDQINKQFGSES